MKKNAKGFALMLLAAATLVGCTPDSPVEPVKSEGGATNSTAEITSTPKEKTRVEKAVEDAESMSREDLYKKAAAELGSNTLHFLATSSRGGKPEIKAAFVKALNDAAGTSIKDSQIDYQSTVDGRIYTMLNAEIDAGTPTYSGALLQDGYQLATKGFTNNYVNYVPKEWAAQTGVNKDRDSNPFSLQFNFKTWMYNNKGDDISLDNVWDITAAKYKGKLDTMDPTNENVNMDWLIQLTSDDNCDMLKAAFDDASNDAKSEINVDAYKQYGDKKKYAMAFIAKYIENSVFYSDDKAAINHLAATPGTIGWIVYSKIQNVTESAAISKKNIVIGALGTDNTDGKTATMKMKGFGGFMYKHYLMLMPDAPLPYTACAYINFLSTTKNGYAKWAGDVGDYPTFGDSINVDRTKNGHGELSEDYKWTQDSTKDNVFPALNDPNGDWWTSSTGGNAVVETPSYIGTYYNRVRVFIDNAIAAKK